MDILFLNFSNDRRIAYRLSEGKGPTVMFLCGFRSDMQGGKAVALEEFCRARGQRFIRFDYTGHGESSGEFIKGTIGSWKQDALDVLDQLGGERVVLVGSSMGAWIALLIAIARPEKVAGLLTLAAAADFTERRIWQQFSESQRNELMEKGVYYAPSCYGEEPYPITKQLIEEAREHLLLEGPIRINAPVRLLHGRLDPDVPWQVSAEIMEKLTSKDVELHVIKEAGHRLSEPAQLKLMCEMVEKLF